jgi:hypothetical protein
MTLPVGPLRCGDDELGDAALIGLGLVVIIAEDEDDVVGVLLDGAGLANRTAAGACPWSRVSAARFLRKRDDRHAGSLERRFNPRGSR